VIDTNLMYVTAALRHKETGERDTFTYCAERDEINEDTLQPVFADMSRSEIRTELLDRAKEQVRCLYGEDWNIVFSTIDD